MRRKLLKFIRKIGKVKEENIAPKWLSIVHCILFPIQSYLYHNKSFNYDLASDCFIINGMEIATELFEDIARRSEKEEFIISKKEGKITWKKRSKK